MLGEDDLVLGPATAVLLQVLLQYSVDHGISWLMVEAPCLPPDVCQQYRAGTLYDASQFPEWQTVTVLLSPDTWWVQLPVSDHPGHKPLIQPITCPQSHISRRKSRLLLLYYLVCSSQVPTLDYSTNSPENGVWLPVWQSKNQQHLHVQSSHLVECIYQCTVAYTGWLPACSVGKCDNSSSTANKTKALLFCE